MFRLMDWCIWLELVTMLVQIFPLFYLHTDGCLWNSPERKCSKAPSLRRILFVTSKAMASVVIASQAMVEDGRDIVRRFWCFTCVIAVLVISKRNSECEAMKRVSLHKRRYHDRNSQVISPKKKKGSGSSALTGRTK